eukprot:5994603-Pyramimonas_sp.AAC.1
MASQLEADCAFQTADILTTTEDDEVIKRRKLSLEASLRRLHANLGHPSNEDMVRILKHAKA